MRLFRARKRSLIGLIGANAPGGSRSEGNEWKLVISFVAIREPDSSAAERNVHCAMTVSHKDLRRHMDRLKPYQVIEVEVDDDSDPHRIIITKIKRIGLKDKALLAIAEKLRESVIFDGGELGEFVLDRRIGCYTGNVEWQNRTIKLRLESSHAEEPVKAMEWAKILLNAEDTWNARIGAFVIEKMLDMKNGEWRDDDETEITGPEFLKRMVPTSLELTEEGSFTFWFDDGELFFGHSIMVDGHLESGLRNASLFG